MTRTGSAVTGAVLAAAVLGSSVALGGCSSSGSKPVATSPTTQQCPSAAAVTKAIGAKVETVKRTLSDASVACGYNSGKTIVIASVTFGLKKGDLVAVANGLGSTRAVRPLTGIGDEAVQLPGTAKDTLIIVVRFGTRAVTVDMDEGHDQLATEEAFARLFA